MNLFTLLDQNTVLHNLEVGSKEQLINVMVDALSSKMDKEALEEIRQGVLEREEVMSTGVGKGLAIPHCKSKTIDEYYSVFALLKEPLEFDSIDGEPVRMVFLLTGPVSKNSLHIKLLSRISRLMNSASFRDKILACNSVEEILETFKAEEEKYFVG